MSECVPCAPGGPNAAAFWRGEDGSVPREALFLLERVALVGAGLFVVGVRGDNLWKGALAGGLSVELFVLGYGYFQR